MGSNDKDLFIISYLNLRVSLQLANDKNPRGNTCLFPKRELQLEPFSNSLSTHYSTVTSNLGK
jgi:hypothetical protein